MNSKTAKKLRKYARQRVDKNLGEGMDALNKIIRKRPGWIPKPVWVLFYLPLFPRKHIKGIYQTLK